MVAGRFHVVAAFLRGNVRKIAVAIAFLFVFSLAFNVSLKALLIVPTLIVLASFSTFYFNYIAMPVNFELVKLSTVLVSAAYGLFPGLAVGVASTFFGKVLIGRIDEKLPLSMLTISAMAIASAAFYTPGSIAGLGIALVLAYNVTMLVLSQLMGGDLAWNIPYEGTNFAFNFFLFKAVAPALIALMA